MADRETRVKEPLRGHYDAIIIGSGAGGSTLAYQLSRRDHQVLVVERGEFLRPEPLRPSDSVGKYMSHIFDDSNNPPFVVGGETKFYGSALYRMRESDFHEVEHESGISPAWPISYADLEPYYERAEALYRVHGSTNGDPTEPPRARPFPHPPIKHDPVVARLVKRLEQSGTSVSSIPVGLDYGPGGKCILCSTCDGYYCQLDAKMDAEISALRPALATGRVRLITKADCLRVLTIADGSRVNGILVKHDGDEKIIQTDVVAVCAGLNGSARLLRRSRTPKHPEGLGNKAGCLGRYLAGHSTGVIFPILGWMEVPPIHSKTFAINSYYNGSPGWPYPTGVIQMAGQMPFWEGKQWPVRALARSVARHSLMCFHMTEALPTRESGFIFQGDEIFSRVAPVHNLETFLKLRRLAIDVFKGAGHFVLSHRRKPQVWHEVGTARFGTDPNISVADLNCQVHGIDGLFVVDASTLPSAGAVNTALTIIALALRAGDYISRRLG
jgi:choline dehydrogenase-like flavoprotein